MCVADDTVYLCALEHATNSEQAARYLSLMSPAELRMWHQFTVQSKHGIKDYGPKWIQKIQTNKTRTNFQFTNKHLI